MGKTLTSRLPDEMIKDIEKIADYEKLDKSSVVRRLLNTAIPFWKLEMALKLYQNGEASLGRASEQSGLSIWEFLDHLALKKIPLNYSLEDLQSDFKVIDELWKIWQ